MLRFRTLTIATLLLCSVTTFSWAQTDPLPSWNDGPSKNAITTFVKAVTDKSSSEYVQVNERIAVFDNDGTLWSEQPAYFQLYFALDRVREMAVDHPD